MTNASRSYTEALANQYRAALNNKVKGGVDYSVLTGDTSAAPIATPKKSDDLHGVRKILDVLSQPLYSTVETAKDTVADVYKGFHGGNAGDVAKGLLGVAPRLLGNLGSDNDKKTWSDVLRGDPEFLNSFNKEAGINHVVTKDNGPLAARQGQSSAESILKFLGGTAADIGGDPSSYVGAGLVKSAVKLPIELAEKTATGAKLIGAAKATKTGQDVSNIAKKLHGIQTGVDAGQAKAANEMADIESAKVEATVGGPLQIEAAQRVPESRQISPYPEAPFDPAPVIGTEQSGDIFHAGRPDIGAEQVDGVFRAPSSGNASAPIAEAAPDIAAKQKKMLYDTLTGDVVPSTAALRKTTVGAEPAYDEVMKAQLQKLWRPLSDTEKGQQQAKAILAARETPVAPEVAPAAEAAASPVVEQTLSAKDFFKSASPEIRQHRLIYQSPEKAKAYLEESGFKNPSAQDIQVTQQESGKIFDDAYKQAQQNFGQDVGAARSAASEEIPFDEYVNQVAATDTRMGKIAKEYKALSARNAKAPLTSVEASKNFVLVDQMLRAAHAKAVSASQTLAKRAPALVRQKAPEVAQQARTEAVAASQAARASRARTASARRLSGAALQSWISKTQAMGLDSTHLIKLLASQEKNAGRTIAGIMRAKTPGTPRFNEILINVYNADKGVEVSSTMPEKLAQETLESPVASAVSQADSVEEILSRANPEPDISALAQIGSGGNMNPALLPRIQKILEDQGWKGPTEELPFESKTGTRRSSKTLGEGVGKNVAYNAPAQMKTFQSVMDLHKEEIALIRAEEKAKTRVQTGVGTKWKIRSGERIYNLIIQDLKDVDDFMFANGVVGTATAGKDGVPLYLSQIMEALNASEPGRNLLYGRILDNFGFRISRVPGRSSGTFLSAKVADRAGTTDIDSLLKLGGRISKVAETADADGIARFNHRFKDFLSEFESTLKGNHVGPQGETERGITKGAPGGTRAPVTEQEAQFVIDDAASAFNDPDTLASLFQSIRENSAKALILFGQETQSVAANTVKYVLDTLDNATGLVNDADRVESLLHPEQFARTLSSSDDVANLAADAAKTKIGEVVPEIDVVNAHASETAFKHGDEATTDTFKNNTNKANTKKHDENYKASAAETPPEDLLNMETQTDIAMQTAIGKMADNFFRRFVASYGNATVHEAITAMGSVGGVMSRAYARELTKTDTLAKQIAATRGINHKDVAKEAWDVLSKGKDVGEVGPEMAPLVQQMRNLTDYMFATGRSDGKAQSVLSQWQREGFDLESINEKLTQPRFGLPEDAVLKLTKKVNKKTVPMTAKEISEQWRTWPVEDPIDFLHRMERVTSELTTEAAISREFHRIAVNKGLASTKPRPGFVGVTRQSLGSESIVKYLPKSERGVTYIHKDLIPEIKRMDSLLGKLNSNNAELRTWLRENLDPILAMWKSGMTIWRPGHHFRNIVGDTGMAFLVSGVKNPVYYAKALKMITAKQNALGRTLRGDYGTWDAMAAMQGIHRAAEGGAFNKQLGDEILKLGSGDAPAGTIARTTIGNKPYEIDDGELFQAMMDRGVLPDFRHQEDIIDVGDTSRAITDRLAAKTGWAGSGGQQVMRKAHNKLAGFSEGRDDFIRLGHALHLVENGIDGKKSWKTVEEMYDQVAARIRKTHPDGTDLTPFEKNVMRRVLPFYSWTRKAIPLVFESMLTRPGRFLTYPKAMYNFGQANGVDLESLSNPFPQDQIFPNFITNKMTGIGWESPDGHYWSFDMGVPQADILNDFIGGGSPKDLAAGALGLLNPAIKVPAEIAAGQQIGSQVPITDASDYVDSQIPGLNSVASIFGISPTSAIENAASGRLAVDPTRQVERGNRGGVFENPEYLANFLLGQRILDNTKPNYVALGQIQALDKMKKAAGN